MDTNIDVENETAAMQVFLFDEPVKLPETKELAFEQVVHFFICAHQMLQAQTHWDGLQ